MKLESRSVPWKQSSGTGRFFLSLLSDTTWIQRRVETIRLLDQNELERSVSLTIDLDDLGSRLKRFGLKTATVAMVPVFTIVKSLLLDLDLRDAAGRSLPMATSAQDSYCAQTVLLAVLEKEGTDPSRLSAAVLEALYGAVRQMLDEETQDEISKIDSPYPVRDYWLARSSSLFSSNRDRDQWNRILNVPAFARLLADFTRQSMAVAPVALDGRTSVIKYRHVELETSASEPSSTESWGIRSFGYMVGASSVGTSQREHVRIVAPPGMNMSSIQLWNKTPDEPYSGQAVGFAADTYQSRVTAERAIVYTRRMTPGSYRVVATLRPRVTTFIAPALFSVGLSVVLLAIVAGLQLFGHFYLDGSKSKLSLLGHVDVNSLVTTLLVGPTLISIFIVRQGEHPLVARLLLRPRIAVLLTAFSLILSALAVSVGAKGWLLEGTFLASLVLCLAVFTLLLVIYGQCSAAATEVRDTGHTVRREHVIVSPYLPD